MLELRFEARRQKNWREYSRPEPPPFLGPLVSLKEAMQALNRSESFVRARLEEGSLNFWKDPQSRRIWILKDDLDRLIDVDRHRRGEPSSRGASKPTQDQNPDASPKGRWVDGEYLSPEEYEEYKRKEAELNELDKQARKAPRQPAKPTPQAEPEPDDYEARFQRKTREIEEWHASELAKLEGRDPGEAVRAVRLERGWLESASEPPTLLSALVAARAKTKARPGHRTSRKSYRPISWSNSIPHSAVPPPQAPAKAVPVAPVIALPRPFPVGWITKHEAAKMLQVTARHFNKVARRRGLQQRTLPGRREFLYDSVEVERYAERRLDESCKVTVPGKRLDWWGLRTNPMHLQEFDYWISAADAGRLLSVTANRIGRMCDQGIFPCKQDKPGVTGSRIYVPHCAVHLLSQRKDYQIRRQKQADSALRSTQSAGGNEDWDLDPFDPSRPSPATRINHGEYLTTRQTALALGVGVGSVNRLRLCGRLAATHLHAKKDGTAKNPWWFFRREDVENLLTDSEYVRHAARGKQAQFRT